jgi:hypothetical protein
MNGINVSAKVSSQLQQKMPLAPGQVIKAQVIKTEGRQIILQVGSNLLKAETKTPLNAGDRLKLQVQAAQNDLIELKILNENNGVKQENIVFLRLGLEPQEELQTILQQLVKFNMPVSQPALVEIYNLVKKYKLTEDLSQLIIWLKSVGIKVDSQKDIQTLKSLQKFIKGEIPSDQEAHFLNFLNGTENNSFGGYNIFGWPVAGHHVYLLTQEFKRKQLQADNCKLFLRVNSQSFEDIWFKMEFINNTLDAVIICNCEKYKKILDREVNLLSEAFQNAGYQINNIPVEVCKSKITIFDLIPDTGQDFASINLEV